MAAAVWITTVVGMTSFLTSMRRYADFSGRSTRREFWLFFVFGVLSYVLLQVLALVIPLVASHGTTLDDAATTTLAGVTFLIPAVLTLLALFIPYLSVSVRRLHDAGFSGWWMLLHLTSLSIVVLIMHCVRSTPGPNQYGPVVGAVQ